MKFWLTPYLFQAITLSSVHLIVGQNLRILFYVVENDDLHQKSYWQPFFDPKQAFFYLLEPLEVPNPDKTPKVNVKTEGLPGNFLVI